MAYLSQEPSDDVAEDDCLVGFVIVWRSGDTCEIPKVAFPLVETNVLAAGIEQQDVRVALDEPAAVEGFDTSCSERLEGTCEMGILWFLGLYLHRCRFVAEGTDEAVSVAIF